jgi:hypothetical protein
MSIQLRQAAPPPRGFTGKQHRQYRFSILLIDDMPRIGLERIYRITMSLRKENDMDRLASATLAVCAAMFLTISAIDAIVTVSTAQAETPAAFALPAVA